MKKSTQKLIAITIQEAKKEFGTKMKNVTVTMNMEADGATLTLARALLAQAEANEANSEAMRKLAESLKPIDVCAIKVG
tara:strand:- start:196 stop:432 length:237 start_codon:yes stop_codon:yes gene_type:complete